MSADTSVDWAHGVPGVVAKAGKRPGDYVPKGATLATMKCAPELVSFEDASKMALEDRSSATQEWKTVAVKSPSAGKVTTAPSVRLTCTRQSRTYPQSAVRSNGPC